MSELANCKCGAPAILSAEYQDCDGNAAVECTVCNMLSWTVEDWNRRPDPAPVGVAHSVADNLMGALIDISESGIQEDGREWDEELHKECVRIAYQAIRENEWYFGGRDKPDPQPGAAFTQADIAAEYTKGRNDGYEAGRKYEQELAASVNRLVKLGQKEQPGAVVGTYRLLDVGEEMIATDEILMGTCEWEVLGKDWAGYKVGIGVKPVRRTLTNTDKGAV